MTVADSRSDVEIILVDNGSTDKTVEIAGEFNNIKILKVPGVNISALRNTGCKHARGKIFAFLDADCMVRNDWLKNCIEYFGDTRTSIVGADPMVPDESNWVVKAWNSMFVETSGSREVNWVASHNIMVRREVFQKIGGFREDLSVSEDVDFCQRARELDYNIISDSKMAVIHLKNPETVRDFYNKELWRGKSSMGLFIENLPHIKGIKPLMLGILTIASLVSLPLAIVTSIYKRSILFSLIPIICMISGPVFLSARSSLRRNNSQYFFSSILLFLVYGTARGVAAMNPMNWRCNQLIPGKQDNKEQDMKTRI